ncbi:MAG: phosphoribosylglycinamide formyltransferase, partial [Firmicutes bacterium]|nr:phosphoribosylglycinamide formyltransferase [Bacillota bacterium]
MDKIKIAALVSGGGTNLGAILENIDSGYIANGEVVTVISSNPNAFALERAAKRGINAVTIRKRDFASAKEYESAMTAHLHKFGVELVVLAGFMVILGPDFINEFRGRIMNIHPALIPSFCGEGFYGLK